MSSGLPISRGPSLSPRVPSHPCQSSSKSSSLLQYKNSRVKYKYDVSPCLPHQMQAQFQGLPEPLLPSGTGLFGAIPWAPSSRAAFICTESGLLTGDRQAGKGSCSFLTRHSFDSCHGKLKTFFLSGLFYPICAATGFLARRFCGQQFYCGTRPSMGPSMPSGQREAFTGPGLSEKPTNKEMYPKGPQRFPKCSYHLS